MCIRDSYVAEDKHGDLEILTRDQVECTRVLGEDEALRELEEEEGEDEELEELPEAEKELDPLYRMMVGKVVDDTRVHGHVQDIVCGRITKERLYLVTYTDG
eukprot:14649986-Alexandrium_andersonii.AAC.1